MSPEEREARIGAAVTALLVDSGLPAFGPHRASVERRQRLAFDAADTAVPDEAETRPSPDHWDPPAVDANAVDRGVVALCRFVIPGALVPRREMARAVLIAAAGGDGWLENLPGKQIVRVTNEAEIQ